MGHSLVADAQSTTNAWYSQSKMFAFGFYPQPQGSSYVVAIWLVCAGENTVVWTANRDDPPVSANATLKLTHQGELVLSSEQGPINKIIAANVSSAVMNDNGNFVLYNISGVVWQSFDHPTDSMLIGQRLSGGSQLVSSVSKTNYSSGGFRIKMQTDGNLVMYPMNSEDVDADSYWTSETSDPTYKPNNSMNYLYLNNTGLLLINGSNSETIQPIHTEPNNPIIYRATLGDDGIFRLYFYNDTNSSPLIVWKKPDQPCDVTNFCGLNSYCTFNDEQPYCVCLPGSDFVDPGLKYGGCERNFTKAMCKKSGKENDTYYSMVPKEGLICKDHPYYSAPTDYKEDCRDTCLDDCDCDAAFYDQYENCDRYKFPMRYVSRVYGDSTQMSYFKTVKVNQNVPANGSNNSSSADKHVTTSNKTWLLIFLISLGFSIYSCISLSLTGFFLFKFCLLKYKRWLEIRTLGLAEDLILQSYSYNELKKATNGFKQELGRGSFGRVYKGRFHRSSKLIAVKRLEKVVDEGEKEFRAEMQVIGRTHQATTRI